jgi:nicotinamidase-related amidase
MRNSVTAFIVLLLAGILAGQATLAQDAAERSTEMATALVIIDIQNDYFPGGALELAGSEAAAQNAALLLAAARAHGTPVVHIQHISTYPGATFFLPDTPGAEINPAVAPLPGEQVIVKHYPNAFRETELLNYLRGQGINTLVIAGMMTHMCVDTTVRAAADLGFSCNLASDACATRALEFGGVAVPAEQVQAAYLAGLNRLFANIAPAAELTGLL